MFYFIIHLWHLLHFGVYVPRIHIPIPHEWEGGFPGVFAMAFAPPNPKKLEYERAMHEAAMREIADLEAAEKRRKEEILRCYEEHTPKQERYEGPMVRFHNDAAARLSQAENAGVVCWERIGRSYGGRRKGNLYRCTVT